MINRVVLVGRITRDPEIQQTTAGVSYTRFSIAIDRPIKNANGERQTDFINCIAWRQQADFIGNFIKKGYMIGVEGRIQTGSYQAQDGSNRTTFEVLCDSVQNLEPRRDNANEPQDPYQAPATSNKNTVEKSNTITKSNEFEVSEDDLPF